MAWLILIFASLIEVIWTTALKYTQESIKSWIFLAMMITMITSVLLLRIAVRVLPIGTAYVVWSGIGSIGTVITGIILFGESVTIGRLSCIFLILFGTLGLIYLTETT